MVVIFNFGHLPFWSSFILVVSHLVRLPFWSFSILVLGQKQKGGQIGTYSEGLRLKEYNRRFSRPTFLDKIISKMVIRMVHFGDILCSQVDIFLKIVIKLRFMTNY